MAATDGAPPAFARPVVVFMQASEEEIEAARAQADLTDEDFHAMTDDLAFYRSSAYEYLQERHLPVFHVSGRRPLRFVLADTTGTYDFFDQEPLDLLIVFDGRRPPRAFAPIDVEQVGEYLAAADSAVTR